ncbi:unnamed protein product [Cladocopium goreaui]|uniref:Uncharacterized protein n=1 Tax=Cladocopium goreaui TaxID=2562237 RepID=A0A9P1D0Y6_9DINO|nr:unnamed protein product [Cladocopium goreaui]
MVRAGVKAVIAEAEQRHREVLEAIVKQLQQSHLQEKQDLEIQQQRLRNEHAKAQAEIASLRTELQAANSRLSMFHTEANNEHQSKVQELSKNLQNEYNLKLMEVQTSTAEEYQELVRQTVEDATNGVERIRKDEKSALDAQEMRYALELQDASDQCAALQDQVDELEHRCEARVSSDEASAGLAAEPSGKPMSAFEKLRAETRSKLRIVLDNPAQHELASFSDARSDLDKGSVAPKAPAADVPAASSDRPENKKIPTLPVEGAKSLTPTEEFPSPSEGEENKTYQFLLTSVRNYIDRERLRTNRDRVAQRQNPNKDVLNQGGKSVMFSNRVQYRKIPARGDMCPIIITPKVHEKVFTTEECPKVNLKTVHEAQVVARQLHEAVEMFDGDWEPACKFNCTEDHPVFLKLTCKCCRRLMEPKHIGSSPPETVQPPTTHAKPIASSSSAAAAQRGFVFPLRAAQEAKEPKAIKPQDLLIQDANREVVPNADAAEALPPPPFVYVQGNPADQTPEQPLDADAQQLYQEMSADIAAESGAPRLTPSGFYDLVGNQAGWEQLFCTLACVGNTRELGLLQEGKDACLAFMSEYTCQTIAGVYLKDLDWLPNIHRLLEVDFGALENFEAPAPEEIPCIWKDANSDVVPVYVITSDSILAMVSGSKKSLRRHDLCQALSDTKRKEVWKVKHEMLWGKSLGPIVKRNIELCREAKAEFDATFAGLPHKKLQIVSLVVWSGNELVGKYGIDETGHWPYDYPEGIYPDLLADCKRHLTWYSDQLKKLGIGAAALLCEPDEEIYGSRPCGRMLHKELREAFHAELSEYPHGHIKWLVNDELPYRLVLKDHYHAEQSEANAHKMVHFILSTCLLLAVEEQVEKFSRVAFKHRRRNMNDYDQRQGWMTLEQFSDGFQQLWKRHVTPMVSTKSLDVDGEGKPFTWEEVENEQPNTMAPVDKEDIEEAESQPLDKTKPAVRENVPEYNPWDGVDTSDDKYAENYLGHRPYVSDHRDRAVAHVSGHVDSYHYRLEENVAGDQVQHVIVEGHAYELVPVTQEMMQPADGRKIWYSGHLHNHKTKFNKVLRGHGKNAGLPFDDQMFLDIEDFCVALFRELPWKDQRLSMQDIIAVMLQDGRGRFQFLGAPGMQIATRMSLSYWPFKVCQLSKERTWTKSSLWKDIMLNGLIPGGGPRVNSGRAHVYCSAKALEDEDFKSGLRRVHPIQLTINMQEAVRDGIIFFKTESEGILTTMTIPARYVITAKDTDTGENLWVRTSRIQRTEPDYSLDVAVSERVQKIEDKSPKLPFKAPPVPAPVTSAEAAPKSMPLKVKAPPPSVQKLIAEKKAKEAGVQGPTTPPKEPAVPGPKTPPKMPTRPAPKPPSRVDKTVIEEEKTDDKTEVKTETAAKGTSTVAESSGSRSEAAASDSVPFLKPEPKADTAGKSPPPKQSVIPPATGPFEGFGRSATAAGKTAEWLGVETVLNRPLKILKCPECDATMVEGQLKCDGCGFIVQKTASQLRKSIGKRRVELMEKLGLKHRVEGDVLAQSMTGKELQSLGIVDAAGRGSVSPETDWVHDAKGKHKRAVIDLSFHSVHDRYLMDDLFREQMLEEGNTEEDMHFFDLLRFAVMPKLKRFPHDNILITWEGVEHLDANYNLQRQLNNIFAKNHKTVVDLAKQQQQQSERAKAKNAEAKRKAAEDANVARASVPKAASSADASSSRTAQAAAKASSSSARPAQEYQKPTYWKGKWWLMDARGNWVEKK